MAAEEALIAISHPASADLDAAGNQYKGVKLVAGGVANFAAATDLPFGILQNAPKAGDPARVGVQGVSKVRIGAAVTVGQQLTFNAAGLAVPAVATNYIIGVAKTAGSASGVVISALISSANPPKA